MKSCKWLVSVLVMSLICAQFLGLTVYGEEDDEDYYIHMSGVEAEYNNGDRLQLSWESNLTDFVIYIMDESKGKTLYKTKTKETSFSLPLPLVTNSTEAYVEIWATFDGENTLATDQATFTILVEDGYDELNAPEILKPRNSQMVQIEDSFIDVEWSSVEGASLYYVEICDASSRDNNIYEVGEEGVASTKVSVPLDLFEAGGSYYVEVTAEDSDGHKGLTSTKRYFDIEDPEDDSVDELLPEDSETVPEISTDETVIEVSISDWVEPFITSIKDKKLLSDTVVQELLVEPQEQVTRAEFCNMLVELYKNSFVEGVSAEYELSDIVVDDINDLDPEVVENIKIAYALGITEGKGSSQTFDPYGNVTRQEMAKMLKATHQALYGDEGSDLDTTMVDAWKIKITDAENIADWALDSMYFFNNMKVIEGYDGVIRPLDNATHEEALALVSKAYDAFQVKEDIGQ